MEGNGSLKGQWIYPQPGTTKTYEDGHLSDALGRVLRDSIPQKRSFGSVKKSKQAPTREDYGNGWMNMLEPKSLNQMGGTLNTNTFYTSGSALESAVTFDSFMPMDDVSLSLELPQRQPAEYKSMKDTALNIKGSEVPSRKPATYTSLKALKEAAK